MHSHPGVRVHTRMTPWYSNRCPGTRTGALALEPGFWHSTKLLEPAPGGLGGLTTLVRMGLTVREPELSARGLVYLGLLRGSRVATVRQGVE